MCYQFITYNCTLLVYSIPFHEKMYIIFDERPFFISFLRRADAYSKYKQESPGSTITVPLYRTKINGILGK